MIAERQPYGTGYSVSTPGGQHVALVNFRQLQTLAAARSGLCHMRLRQRRSPYACDYYLEPECDVYGIGYGTVSELQNHWQDPLLTKPEEEGPIGLTAFGNEVLDAILNLGVTLPSLVGEVVA